jgi:hypothetical protein
MCAQHTWHSLGGDRGCPPAWSCPNANAVYDKVIKSGRYWTTPHRGDIALWRYGSNGHAARVYDEAGTKIATTNPSSGPSNGTGVEPIGYPAKWGATTSKRIFTDTYNGIKCFNSGDSGSDAPYVTDDVYRSKCGFGEPSNGDSDSDTVKELQERLNRISLAGGEELTVDGRYGAQTDDEVRKWQEQICGDPPDPVNQSYLGPSQFKKMFPDADYTLHDDGDPAIADGPTPPEPETPDTDGSNTTLGQWLKAQGWVVHDSDVPLGRESTWRKVEFLMVHHTGSYGNDASNPADMAEYIRHSQDPDTYPPLAQLLLDQKGEVWICCRERDGQAAPGRASHAGSGDGYGVPDDSMNERCLGVEHMCDGTHPLSTHAVMYDASLRLYADLRTYFAVPKDKVIGHKEWSDTGKTDPKDDMGVYRNAVENVLNPPIPPQPEPPDPPEPPESITFPLGIEYWYSGKPTGEFTFSGSKKYLDIPAWAPKKKGFTFGMIYVNVDIDGEFRTYLARLNPTDETALQTHFGDEGGDNYTGTHVWFEKGEANRQLRYGVYSQDGQTGTITTRYVKFLAIPESVFVDLGNVLGMYSVARTTYNVTKEHLPKAVVALFIVWVLKAVKEMKASG